MLQTGKPSPADGNSAQLQVNKDRKMHRSDFCICLSSTDIELLSKFSVILEHVEGWELKQECCSDGR